MSPPTEQKVQPYQFVRNLRGFRYRESLMTLAAGLVVVASIAFFPGVDGIDRGLQAQVGPVTILLFLSVAVAAAIVKGTIGFGFALITTPAFASVVDPTLAVVVLTIPPWMINVFQVGETSTGLDYVRDEWALILLALVGSSVGVFFLASYSTGPLIPFIIGLILLAYVAFEVVSDFVVVERAHHPLALGAAGLGGGFLLGAANLGPVLPAYLHTFERDTEHYVGGLSMVFAFIFSARILQMAVDGLLTPYRLWLGSVIAVVTLAGLLLGTYLRRLEIDEEKFNWAVVAILLLIALNIFRKTVPALFF